MNTFLDILGQFIKIFVDLIPRFANRPASTDSLVVDAFLFGPHVCRSRPVLYVPVLDITEYWPRTEENVNTETQSLVTADGVSVTVDTGFAYRITDPLEVRRYLHDSYQARAAMIVRGEVRSLVCGHTYNHITTSGTGSRLLESLEADVEVIFSEYGLELTCFCIEDFAIARNIRHFGVNFFQNTNIGGE